MKARNIYNMIYDEVCDKVDGWLCWGFTARQPNGVMSSAVSLPNHTFTGQA